MPSSFEDLTRSFPKPLSSYLLFLGEACETLYHLPGMIRCGGPFDLLESNLSRTTESGN
jgi:hypothetical protein